MKFIPGDQVTVDSQGPYDVLAGFDDLSGRRYVLRGPVGNGFLQYHNDTIKKYVEPRKWELGKKYASSLGSDGPIFYVVDIDDAGWPLMAWTYEGEKGIYYVRHKYEITSDYKEVD